MSLQQFGEFVLKAQLVKEKAARRRKSRWRTRCACSARSWSAAVTVRIGRCVRLNTRSASISSTSSSEQTGIGGRAVPWWTSRVGQIHLIYTHVVKELRNPARSPLDILRTGVDR